MIVAGWSPPSLLRQRCRLVPSTLQHHPGIPWHRLCFLTLSRCLLHSGSASSSHPPHGHSHHLTLLLLFYCDWCQSWSRCMAKSNTPSEVACVSTDRKQNPLYHQNLTRIICYRLWKESFDLLSPTPAPLHQSFDYSSTFSKAPTLPHSSLVFVLVKLRLLQGGICHNNSSEFVCLLLF